MLTIFFTQVFHAWNRICLHYFIHLFSEKKGSLNKFLCQLKRGWGNLYLKLYFLFICVSAHEYIMSKILMDLHGFSHLTWIMGTKHRSTRSMLWFSFFFLRQDFSIQPVLSLNSLCRPCFLELPEIHLPDPLECQD